MKLMIFLAIYDSRYVVRNVCKYASIRLQIVSASMLLRLERRLSRLLFFISAPVVRSRYYHNHIIPHSYHTVKQNLLSRSLMGHFTSKELRTAESKQSFKM